MIDTYGKKIKNILDNREYRSIGCAAKYYDISNKLKEIKNRVGDDMFSSDEPNLKLINLSRGIIHVSTKEQAKALYKYITDDRYFSMLFKDISEDDIIYYAEER